MLFSKSEGLCASFTERAKEQENSVFIGNSEQFAVCFITDCRAVAAPWLLWQQKIIE